MKKECKMKKIVSLHEFKAAMKRNKDSKADLIYTKYGYYLLTRKAQFYFRANSFIERTIIMQSAKEYGYIPCSQETFLTKDN